MPRNPRTCPPGRRSLPGLPLVAAATLLAFGSSLSAHIVRGLDSPTLATAFVSSPSAAQDAPLRLGWGAVDSGLRVVCFNVANTSPPRIDDPAWPRVTAVGIELPGSARGFALVAPLDAGWDLVEQHEVRIPGHGPVSLDVALVSRGDRAWLGQLRQPPGLPPGQPAVRGSGTRFCISGPFSDTIPDLAVPGQSVPTTIEQLINGVVIGFCGVDARGRPGEIGVWENPLRVIPLYPVVP